MSASPPVYRYGDFPELFWDLQRDEVVDGTNPAIIARLLEHAEPEVIWKLVPARLLMRDFEKLDLPEHTHRFWSVAVAMLRERSGMPAPVISERERGIAFRTRPRFHQRTEEQRSIATRDTYRYGDLPALFWDRAPDQEVDGTDPAVLARLLEDAPPEVIWKIVPREALIRNFESLDLQEHTRRFWSLVVDMLRTRAETANGSQSAA